MSAFPPSYLPIPTALPKACLENRASGGRGEVVRQGPANKIPALDPGLWFCPFPLPRGLTRGHSQLYHRSTPATGQGNLLLYLLKHHHPNILHFKSVSWDKTQHTSKSRHGPIYPEKRACPYVPMNIYVPRGLAEKAPVGSGAAPGSCRSRGQLAHLRVVLVPISPR